MTARRIFRALVARPVRRLASEFRDGVDHFFDTHVDARVCAWANDTHTETDQETQP